MMSKDRVSRGLRELSGSPDRCFIIAEVAQAHDGSLGMAHAFIDAIARAGADAVKFQTHIAWAESTPEEPWRTRFSSQDDTRYEYWKRMEFTEPQWAGLKAHAQERGLDFLSSPFSIEAVHLLRRVGVAAWKLPSGEITNGPLLDAVAETRLPILISTGMSGMPEIDAAVERVRAHGLPLAVLQCTSAYPCPMERVGLNVIEEFRERYRVPVGLSDHSGTIFPGLAAATVGVGVLEVHVTLSRDMFGPDVVASVTTQELRTLVEGVRAIERMVDHPVNKDREAAGFQPLRQTFMKSIVAARDLEAGVTLAPDDLTLRKPGTGIPASELEAMLGRRLERAVPAGHFLTEQDLEVIDGQ